MITPHIETHIRRAGILIGIGLVLQAITLFSMHPLSFMAFLLVACPLVGVGILLYLYTLVTPGRESVEKPVNDSADSSAMDLTQANAR